MEPFDSDDECTDERRNRVRFLSWLFLSALPALITSAWIDILYKIPSMPIGTYLSTTWMAVCILFAIDPNFDKLDDFFGWWSVVTAGPWLLLLFLAHLTNRSTKRRRAWGINFASLVYTAGFFILLNIFYDNGVTSLTVWWKWIIMNSFVLPVLLLMSILTGGQVFVLVLMSAVILIDVWKFTTYILYTLNFENAAVPIVSVVLAVSGLLLGLFGYLLSKQQSRIQTAVSKQAKVVFGRWVKVADPNNAASEEQEENRDNVDGDDDDGTNKSDNDEIEVYEDNQ